MIGEKVMIKKDIAIKNEMGLTARAAATFVQHTNRYACDIFILMNDVVIDAKSIMGIISLGVRKGIEITLTCDGIDEHKAMDDLINMINNELTEI